MSTTMAEGNQLRQRISPIKNNEANNYPFPTKDQVNKRLHSITERYGKKMAEGRAHRHRTDKYLDTLLANRPISDGEATDHCQKGAPQDGGLPELIVTRTFAVRVTINSGSPLSNQLRPAGSAVT